MQNSVTQNKPRSNKMPVLKIIMQALFVLTFILLLLLALSNAHGT